MTLPRMGNVTSLLTLLPGNLWCELVAGQDKLEIVVYAKTAIYLECLLYTICKEEIMPSQKYSTQWDIRYNAFQEILN